MTFGSIDPSQIGQVLDYGHSQPVTGVPVTAADQSFSSLLAQAASESELADTISSSSGGTALGKAVTGEVDLAPEIGGAQAELNLVALLLSSGQSLGAAGVANSGPGTASAGIQGQEVVDKALSLQGTPYVWGGTTPQGFDCSGFTKYVYAQLGISLPRTSEQQAAVGTPVQNLAEAQPGDLVLFAGSDGTPSSPGHVGIYLGQGEMIDAPYSGASVRIEPLSSAGQVVAIRRVLPVSYSAQSTLIGRVNVPNMYVSTIEQAATANGIPASLLAALLNQESRFNPAAVSPAGAQGIAQFMPGTAAGLGVNPDDPVQAINGAAKLISSYAREFGSYSDALAAYNASSAAVKRYGGVPPYPETRAYVSAILSSAGLSGSKGNVI